MSRMMRLLNTKTWFRAIIYQVTPIKENSRTLVRKNKKPKINTKKNFWYETLYQNINEISKFRIKKRKYRISSCGDEKPKRNGENELCVENQFDAFGFLCNILSDLAFISLWTYESKRNKN